MLGNGNGSLQPPTALSFSTQGLALTDFNGDGNLDLAIVDGFLGIALGNGDGTFQPPQFLAGGFYGPLAADFYNDGKPDLA